MIQYQPLYTLTDISRYARVNPATVRIWATAHRSPLLIPADRASLSPFSFINLVEAHVLAALRRVHQVPMQRIRSSVQWLRRELETRHPLAEIDVETDGREIFARRLGLLVSATAGGQVAFSEILDRYLDRIERGPNAVPNRFFPYTYDDCPKLIVMDPRIAYGRPVVDRTRVSTVMIYDRYSGGESLTDIARDYDLDLRAVEEALRCEIERRAA